jgi:hypothetical protein
VQLRDDLL